MIDRLGRHRADDRDVVRHAADVREKFADFRAAVSEFFEVELRPVALERLALELRDLFALEYVRREMLDESGGFYSTQDADSEGEEGKFFVWSPEEIAAIIGKDQALEFCEYFDVTVDGNFEGKSILNVKIPVAIAPGSDTTRAKLFAEREKRIKPHRDEKVLTAWNGLMLAAFADAAAVLANEEYLGVAKGNAEFILTQLQKDGRLLRTWKDGTAKLNGYVEDYANVADGLICLYQVSG